MKKSLHALLGGTFVFITAFLLNFLWESVHAVLFYAGHADYSANFFVKMILYVSFIDALLILGIFLAGCLFWKGDCWIKKYDLKKILFTAVAGFIIAVAIEAKALFFQQWAYTELMPTIFGMGASPLIQLSITGIIALWLSSYFFYKKLEDSKITG